MKKLLFSMFMLCTLCMTGFAQTATMPKIVVFPDDVWMRDHGFMTEEVRDGKKIRIPRYADAFAENREIGDAITSVQSVFEERDFRHEDLQGVLKRMDMDRAVEMARQEKGFGTENGLMEKILEQATPDIRIDLDYAVKTVGRLKDIQFKLKAVDAYCQEQVAACQGTVIETADPTPLALQKIIYGKSEEFCQQIIKYFLDLRENGRKIRVVFRAEEGTNIDFLNDEVGTTGDVYTDYLYDWLQEHSVNRSCAEGNQTDQVCEFTMVRVPFYDEKTGNPTTARRWARGIIKDFGAGTGLTLKNDIGGGLGLVNFRISK